jgi:hypothetical protein
METLWHDKALRQEMANSAAERAETFSLDRMLDRLQSLYLKTLPVKAD